MGQRVAQLIVTRLGLVEIVKDTWMLDGYRVLFQDQILLRNISLVAARLVLREQVVKRLILVRSDFLRDRLVPRLSVRILRIDVINHPAKPEETVRDNLANIEFSTVFHGSLIVQDLGQVQYECRH